jgi:hypothetical protein
VPDGWWSSAPAARGRPSEVADPGADTLEQSVRMARVAAKPTKQRQQSEAFTADPLS